MSYFINSTVPTIFIHIPKTAGSSVLKLIKENYEYFAITNNRTLNENYHSTLNDLSNFVCEFNSKFYIFTIVRNPWSRAASWFYFRRDVLRKGLKTLSAGKQSSKVVNDYDKILLEYEIMHEDFNKWVSKYISSTWDHTWFRLADPQICWIESNYFKVNKIIKFENVNNEIAEVSIFKNKILPLHNVGPVKYNYIDIYNSQSINLIKKIYEVDIDTFKYTFN